MASHSVLHVTTSFPRGTRDSSGVFVRHLVEAERAQGWRVDVAAPPRNGILGSMRHPARWPQLALDLVRLLVQVRGKAATVDVVHAHWWPTALVALLARPRARVVLTMHGSDVALLRSPVLRAIGRATLRRCQVVTAVSRELAREASYLSGLPVDRVVENGDVRPRIDDAGERDRIVFAGHLESHKGAHDLPTLVHELHALELGLPVHIYGDGTLMPELRRQLAGTDAVLHGDVPHEQLLAEGFARAAVAVCPSYAEGYGIVCREALNRGVPVAAYATGGLVGQLVDEPAGRLVEPGDVAGLARATTDLARDEPLRRDALARARDRASQVRTWSDVAADYIALYAAASTR